MRNVVTTADRFLTILSLLIQSEYDGVGIGGNSGNHAKTMSVRFDFGRQDPWGGHTVDDVAMRPFQKVAVVVSGQKTTHAPA